MSLLLALGLSSWGPTLGLSSWATLGLSSWGPILASIAHAGGGCGPAGCPTPAPAGPPMDAPVAPDPAAAVGPTAPSRAEVRTATFALG